MTHFCSIVQGYYPDDVRIRKQCETLASNGYQVSVISLKKLGDATHEVINGIEVHRVNLRKKRSTKNRYIFEYTAFFILAFIKINKLSKNKKFSIIQTCNLPDFLVFTTIFQKLLGAKIILDMHEIMPEFFMSKYKITEVSPIVNVLKKIEKLSLSYADRVITINEMARQVFNQRAIPDKDITIVMNTIDESIVAENPRKLNRGFNLVYHGFLHEMYGIDIAIHALRKFSDQCKDFKFYIFGYGPQEHYLKQLIIKYGLTEHINLMGKVPYGEMMAYLKKMDIGILPSRKDVFMDLSFSNKLSEYIYFKIPVISSNLKTTQFYFSDDEITFFTSGEPNSLSDQIAFAHQNPELMLNKALKAYETYQSINWSVMKKRYLTLVNSLNGQRPR